MSLQVVGIAQMAMLGRPSSAASLLTRRLVPMMGIAATIGAFLVRLGCSILGLNLDIASGRSGLGGELPFLPLTYLFANPYVCLVWRQNESFATGAQRI